MENTLQHRETTVLVANAVSDALETPITELPPLSDAIDLEALDAIVPPDSSLDVTVTFTYEGLRVFVHSGQTVYVYPNQGKYMDSLAMD